ncbi:hypothetical protein ACFLYL_05145 [Chloroflexota bacterium]
MKRNAIEEHFWTEGFVSYLRSRKDYPHLEKSRDEEHGEIDYIWHSPSLKAVLDYAMTSRLLDLEELRLREMDEAGIDMQVLSISAPGVEVFDAETGTSMARKVNDEIAGVIRKYPKSPSSI